MKIQGILWTFDGLNLKLFLDTVNEHLRLSALLMHFVSTFITTSKQVLRRKIDHFQICTSISFGICHSSCLLLV